MRAARAYSSKPELKLVSSPAIASAARSNFVRKAYSMLIKCDSIRLELKVRGSPSVKGQLIDFVRSKAPKHPKVHNVLKQVQCNGQSYVKYYARSY